MFEQIGLERDGDERAGREAVTQRISTPATRAGSK